MLSFNIPDTNSIEVIADWAEFYIALTQEELSKRGLSSYIEESSGSEPAEDEVDNVWLELERRIRLYGNPAPFLIQGDIIRCQINWHELPEYMVCLIFSLVGNPVETTASGQLFERISNEAARNFIVGDSIIYGFPNTLSAQDVATALNERFVYEPPSTRKDRDLDLVVWKSFDDDRCSQLVFLIQCAAGHNWPSKLKDLNVDAWRSYIHFAARPVKGFAIPVIITDRGKLQEISMDGGIIIDRARIYKNTVSATPTNNLRRDLTAWCNWRLPDIRESN